MNVNPVEASVDRAEHAYDSEVEILSNHKDLKLFERCDAIFIYDDLTAVTAASTDCLSAGNNFLHPYQEDEDMCRLCFSLCPQEEDFKFLLDDFPHLDDSLEHYAMEDQLQMCVTTYLCLSRLTRSTRPLQLQFVTPLAA